MSFVRKIIDIVVQRRAIEATDIMSENMPRLGRFANCKCILFLAAHEELSSALDVLDRDVGEVELPLDAVDSDAAVAPLDPGDGIVLVDDLGSYIVDHEVVRDGVGRVGLEPLVESPSEASDGLRAISFSLRDALLDPQGPWVVLEVGEWLQLLHFADEGEEVLGLGEEDETDLAPLRGIEVGRDDVRHVGEFAKALFDDGLSLRGVPATHDHFVMVHFKLFSTTGWR